MEGEGGAPSILVIQLGWIPLPSNVVQLPKREASFWARVQLIKSYVPKPLGVTDSSFISQALRVDGDKFCHIQIDIFLYLSSWKWNQLSLWQRSNLIPKPAPHPLMPKSGLVSDICGIKIQQELFYRLHPLFHLTLASFFFFFSMRCIV